jgi:hypothetical protein
VVPLVLSHLDQNRFNYYLSLKLYLSSVKGQRQGKKSNVFKDNENNSHI